jgi:hypothetical protein
VLSLFPRQIRSLRSRPRGQATVLLLTTVSVLLALTFSTIRVQHLGTEKVAVANAVDAVALSAATWEARGLNIIAALNDGILQCLRLIRSTCIVWAALAVAACFGATGPFLEYSRRAPKIIRNLWDCATQLAKWSEQVKEATPLLVLREAASLSRRTGVTGVLFPFNPRGAHDARDTLELHLTHGPPLTLADAISPITAVPAKIGKWKWAKKLARMVTRTLGAALGTLSSGTTQPIRMLVPEEDLPRRQRVRFAGGKTPSSLPISYPAPGRSALPLADSATAEVYGGGAAEMGWRSRLVPEGENP